LSPDASPEDEGRSELFHPTLALVAAAESAAGYLLARGPNPRSVLTLALVAISSAALHGFAVAAARFRRLPAGTSGRRLSPGLAAVAAFLVSAVAMLFASREPLGQRLTFWSMALTSTTIYLFACKAAPLGGLIHGSHFWFGISAAFELTADSLWPVALSAVPFLAYATSLAAVSRVITPSAQRRRLVLAISGMIVSALVASTWTTAYPEALSYARMLDWSTAPTLKSLIEVAELVAVKVRPTVPSALASIAAAGYVAWRAVRARDAEGVARLVRDGGWGILLVLSALVSPAEGVTAIGLILGALFVPAAAILALRSRGI
jgi:hypothetical protein